MKKSNFKAKIDSKRLFCYTHPVKRVLVAICGVILSFSAAHAQDSAEKSYLDHAKTLVGFFLPPEFADPAWPLRAETYDSFTTHFSATATNNDFKHEWNYVGSALVLPYVFKMSQEMTARLVLNEDPMIYTFEFKSTSDYYKLAERRGEKTFEIKAKPLKIQNKGESVDTLIWSGPIELLPWESRNHTCFLSAKKSHLYCLESDLIKPEDFETVFIKIFKWSKPT